MTLPELDVLVDLGNVSDVPAVTDAGPGWVRKRPIRYAIPVVSALLLLGAAAPVPRPRLAEVVNVAVGAQAHVLIAGDRLFVDAYGLRDTITAYGLGNGRRLWSVNEQERPGLGMLASSAGAIVVSSYAEKPRMTSTESFDAATGRRLWASDLGSAALTGHGVLVQAAPSLATLASGFEDSSGYQLLDPRTGAVIWSLDIPDGCVTAFADAGVPTTLVEVCDQDSSVRAIDLADGRTVAERLVPLGQDIDIAELDPAQVMERPQVVVVGRTVLIAHANVPTPTVDAYALDSLVRRWGGLAEEQAQYVSSCGGDAICFYATPDAGIRISVATGESLGPVTPPPARTVPGALQLVGPDGSRTIDVPSVPVGTDVSVLPDGTGTVWLERSPHELIAPLPDVGATSCVRITAYIVCATVNDRLRVWRLS